MRHVIPCLLTPLPVFTVLVPIKAEKPIQKEQTLLSAMANAKESLAHEVKKGQKDHWSCMSITASITHTASRKSRPIKGLSEYTAF